MGIWALRNIYRKIVPDFIKRKIGGIRWKRHYYGQDGEDAVLRVFCMKREYRGFYVDIGAFHPKKYSNTQWFYERGWHGINIDANPCSIELFSRQRKRDVNIVSGVSGENGEMDFYYFGGHSTENTFDKKMYKELIAEGAELKEIKKVKVKTINEILDKNLSAGQSINFVNLDVEGFEMKILNAYNFEKYAPEYFLIEDHGYAGKNTDFMGFSESPLYKFMKKHGYIVIAKTRLTIIFKKKQ